MKQLLLISSLLLLTQVTHAVSKSDFAYGYTLEVDGDGAIYSLTLPEDVYHGLTRADRGDLRIFNSQDVAVPHHIKRAEQMTKVAQPDVSLPLFPLYSDTTNTQTTDGHNIHIVTNDKGAIIDINYGKAGTDATRKVSGYILDSSQLQQAPVALIINWQESEADFVTSVEVEGSDDLNHWLPLVTRSTLSNLHYGENTLIQRRIDLPLHKQRYLRLTWTGDKPLLLASVIAQFPESYHSQERKWSTFNVTSTDAKNNYYYFDTHSVLPADRVNIDLPQRNTLVRVSLESAGADTGPWYPRFNGLLYDLQFEGNQLKTPDQVMSITTHRYWRLQILSREGQQNGNPKLRLGWIPEQLFFIAQGEAPFTLAYGSARVGPVDTPLAQLLNLDKIQNQQQLIKAAQLGSPIELGNRDKLKPAKPPTNWQQIVLWLVLIFGVAALAFMALRLYKQLEKAEPRE
jgi:hypothetical protein